MFCHAVRAATMVRSRSKDPLPNWLHSLLLSICVGFGGGIFAPLFLGLPSMILKNNWIFIMSVLAWYLTHYVKGMQEFLTSTPVEMAWGLGHALFRVITISNSVMDGNRTLPADPNCYPIPLVGPIIVGTLTGVLGMFVPFDKGLSAVYSNTPWPIQGSVITATVFHLVVHDTNGPLGVWLRKCSGFDFVFEGANDAEKKVGVRVLLLAMWIVQQWGQTLRGPNFNIFQPIYKGLYRIFMIEDPNLKVKDVKPAPVGESKSPKSSISALDKVSVAGSLDKKLRKRHVK